MNFQNKLGCTGRAFYCMPVTYGRVSILEWDKALFNNTN